MEERQDKWIKKLIEPQTNNEARLFSIDTRINEGEVTRLNDQNFMKETLKKLIYAVEQSTISKSKETNGGLDSYS